LKRKEDDWYYAEMVKNEMDIRVARNIKRLRQEHGISRAEMEEGAGLPYWRRLRTCTRSPGNQYKRG
jgi:hypothetical protein